MTHSLIARFAARAAAGPTVPALIWEGRPVGYGELYAMAARARVQVESAAPDAGRPVGLRVGKSPEAIALVLGCLLAGRRFLLPSHELPEAPLKELYQQADCAVVLGLTDGPLVDRVVNPAAGHPEGEHREPAAVEDDAIAFMLTTSGSTGLPKVVPLPSGATDRFAEWAAGAFGITTGTVVLNYAPLNFDLCLLDVWTTLAYGGTVVLADPERGASAGYLRDLVTDHSVTVIQGVPLLFQLLVEAADGSALDTAEHIVFAGDSMPARVLTALSATFPTARWYNNYGCTETNNSFLHEVDRDLPVHAPLPIGRPLPGVSSLVIGADGRALTGPGRGELLVSTPFQSPGYLNAPNAKTFAPHPDGTPGLVYYHSGDMVTRHEDGALSVIGRTDFMVKVRGFRISTQSIEQILLEHPAVTEAAVIALPDPVAGHRLHARLCLTGPGATDGLALRRHCAERSVRAAIPAVIEIVSGPLPRTSTGKVDRNKIKAALLAAAGPA